MPHNRALFPPTSHAQVSGHRFLMRRMHHGLVLGDIRMIHDPLATRQRAATFGLVITVLLLMGSGLLAVMDPKPMPGEDTPILRAASGALYVRVGEDVHPVLNLSSARLIVGQPAEPADISDEALAELRHGRPVGIADAPGFLAAENPAEEERTWAVCTMGDQITVSVGTPPLALGEGEAVLLRDTTSPEPADYLATSRGRALLPSAGTPEGVVVRRRLGIEPHSPVWTPPAPVIAAITRQPDIAFPARLPEVVHTEEGAWISQAEGAREISELQAEMLSDMGAASRRASRAEIAARPQLTERLMLPEEKVRVLDPGDTDLCVFGEEGQVGRAPHLMRPVPLPETHQYRGELGIQEGAGERLSVADSFVTHLPGAIAVDTGFGYHVVTADGVRHSVAQREGLEAMGFAEAIPGWWPALALLPEGSPLNAEEALRGN